MDDSLDPFARRAAHDAIIAKRDRLIAERGSLLEQRGQILAQIRRADRELADCRAAARLFDLEIEFPDDDDRPVSATETAVMEFDLRRVREQRRALAAAIDATNRKIAQQTVVPGTVVYSPTITTTAPEAIATAKRPAIRDIVIEQLQLSSPQGRKAAELREYIERTFGEAIHEKTVGMTLYRLSKDRLVRRDGHVWFYGSAPAETGSPGDDSPRLEDLLK